ncbi:hypothetical protein LPTSP3_g20900 [Leptospira kobayashii]|uniref:Glycosyltransferase family 9 protein n=1 Tax=Leptospira kobayashii TaxID=1917830 RepID=A0ABN6KDR5_9LEPT|nr:glycosyltransferase family 9 protein [Leptospira kobayashii]BDA79160.1 hypothetical protein LPTSP3_g20900 [Leptospira kobayashii]
MKILIVHTSGIGDFVFFSPVISFLKEKFPQSSFHLILGTPGTKQITDMYDCWDATEVFNVRTRPFDFFKIAFGLIHIKFDLVIFSSGINFYKSLFASFLIRFKKLCIVSDSNTFGIRGYVGVRSNIHSVEKNKSIIEYLGGDKDKYQPFLPKQNSLIAETGSVDKIWIHPGCDPKFKFKRYPAAKYITIIKELIRSGRSVTVDIGPGEEDLLADFSVIRNTPFFQLKENLSIVNLVSELSQYSLVLTNDSGIGHIAAALDLPVLSIHGATDPKIYGPYSPKSEFIISANPPDCMPCFRKGGRYGCEEIPCLTSISEAEILKRIDMILVKNK